MKWLVRIAGTLLVLVAVGYVFREPLVNKLVDFMTANMYVAEDKDTFDPGVKIGQPLPALRAIYQGKEITSLTGLTGPRGVAFYVNRSVDW